MWTTTSGNLAYTAGLLSVKLSKICKIGIPISRAFREVFVMYWYAVIGIVLAIVMGVIILSDKWQR